ncbi:MAG: TadE/TadG family type IV pilus assembly protein, partial [Fuerstiella sp.]
MATNVIYHRPWFSEMNLGNRALLKRLIVRKFSHAWTRLWRNTEGVSAVEFAMILPFMLLLFIGTVEITDVFDKDRKVNQIASAITDLTAQAQTVTADELDSVIKLGKVILGPYPNTQLEVILASVSFNDEGKATVDWSRDNKKGAPWDKGKAPPITLPDTLAAPNTSVVAGQVNLTYAPLFAGLLTSHFDRASSVELSEIYFLRPRL